MGANHHSVANKAHYTLITKCWIYSHTQKLLWKFVCLFILLDNGLSMAIINIKLFFSITKHNADIIHITAFDVNYNNPNLNWWCDSIVLIVTRQKAGYTRRRGSIPVSGTDFSLLQTTRTPLKPNQPFVQWVLGGLFGRLKWPKHETDQSFPFSAEAIIPIPCISLWFVKEPIFVP